ncbi:hypothetical protein ACOCG7_07445 [Paraburkholderia sp. DD10]|uniref:hypothetical protein n=1 Tax=Paraburkholderia sp. DD10 TaxID=3409691 RepID=UPI0012B97703
MNVSTSRHGPLHLCKGSRSKPLPPARRAPITMTMTITATIRHHAHEPHPDAAMNPRIVRI